jgi:hypothetical protein
MASQAARRRNGWFARKSCGERSGATWALADYGGPSLKTVFGIMVLRLVEESRAAEL